MPSKKCELEHERFGIFTNLARFGEDSGCCRILSKYADELRPGPMRWLCCTPINFQANAVGRATTSDERSTLSAQQNAFAGKFAPRLLRPFSGMNISVRLGEIAQTMLSRWPIRPQRG